MNVAVVWEKVHRVLKQSSRERRTTFRGLVAHPRVTVELEEQGELVYRNCDAEHGITQGEGGKN